MKGHRREEVAVTFESLLAKVGDSFHAKRAFGPLIEADGCQIIPVALSAGGGGGGEGASGDEPSPGDGFGGGFGGVSWPLGVYVVKDGTAKWVPAVAAPRIALGVIAAVRVALRLGARGANRPLYPRSHRDLAFRPAAVPVRPPRRVEGCRRQARRWRCR